MDSPLWGSTYRRRWRRRWVAVQPGLTVDPEPAAKSCLKSKPWEWRWSTSGVFSVFWKSTTVPSRADLRQPLPHPPIHLPAVPKMGLVPIPAIRRSWDYEVASPGKYVITDLICIVINISGRIQARLSSRQRVQRHRARRRRALSPKPRQLEVKVTARLAHFTRILTVTTITSRWVQKTRNYWMPSPGGRINERMPMSISCGLLKVGVVIPCFSFLVVTHGSFTL